MALPPAGGYGDAAPVPAESPTPEVTAQARGHRLRLRRVWRRVLFSVWGSFAVLRGPQVAFAAPRAAVSESAAAARRAKSAPAVEYEEPPAVPTRVLLGVGGVVIVAGRFFFQWKSETDKSRTERLRRQLSRFDGGGDAPPSPSDPPGPEGADGASADEDEGRDSLAALRSLAAPRVPDAGAGAAELGSRPGAGASTSPAPPPPAAPAPPRGLDSLFRRSAPKKAGESLSDLLAIPGALGTYALAFVASVDETAGSLADLQEHADEEARQAARAKRAKEEAEAEIARVEKEAKAAADLAAKQAVDAAALAAGAPAPPPPPGPVSISIRTPTQTGKSLDLPDPLAGMEDSSVAVKIRKLDAVPEGADPLGDLSAANALTAPTDPELARAAKVAIEQVDAPPEALGELELLKERLLNGDDDAEMKAVQRVTKALLTARVDEALAALEGASKAGVGGMTAASSAESSLAQVDATIDAVIVLLRGMGLAFGNNGLKSLYTGSASPRQLNRLLKARIASMMGNMMGAGGVNAQAGLLGELAGTGADAATEAVERLALVVGVAEKQLEKLYEEQLRALMSGNLDPSGGGGGGLGGLLGGLGSGFGGGGAGGKGGGMMDQKSLKELVPALAQLQALVDAGQIDDSMLKELKGQLTSQGGTLSQLVQAMDLLADGAVDAPELPPEMKTAEMRVTFKKLGQMLRKMERL